MVVHDISLKILLWDSFQDEELAESRERLRCLEMMRNDADSRRAKMLEDRSLEESKKRLEDSEKRVEAHIRRLREEHDHQKYGEILDFASVRIIISCLPFHQ